MLPNRHFGNVSESFIPRKDDHHLLRLDRVVQTATFYPLKSTTDHWAVADRYELRTSSGKSANSDVVTGILFAGGSAVILATLLYALGEAISMS